MFKIQNSIQQVYRFYTYRNVGFQHRNDIGCVLLQCIGLSWVPLGELGGGYLLDRWNIGISGLSFASLHHLTTISTSSHNHLHYHHGILFTASILTKLGLFFFEKKWQVVTIFIKNISITRIGLGKRLYHDVVDDEHHLTAFIFIFRKPEEERRLMPSRHLMSGTSPLYPSWTNHAALVHWLLWWYICCYGGTFDAMVVHLMLKWYICCCWKNVTAHL